MTTEVFGGHIAGVGAADGTRVVVGRWLTSPLGRFADVMVERADGTRLLLAPDLPVARLVAATYTFDDVLVAPVMIRTDPRTRTWHVRAGRYEATLTIGARTGVGQVLRLLPAAVTRTQGFASLADPVARVLLGGVRTSGSARDGAHERYAAADQHRIVDARQAWGGTDLGPLVPIDPPVRFGFGSVPRTPSVTRVTSHVERAPTHAGPGRSDVD
ncbi:hypothetical protein ACGIF2_01420 [Cellulomonas sp. P22]|uniref:hypothetical protein n=1 Tax=Cellulomonas sp. P22 TaxID=3373189 RepID=UPI00379499F2